MPAMDRTRPGRRRCYGGLEMTERGDEVPVDTARPSHLRLVWSNPRPPLPRVPVDFAAAIERHLSGQDGLTDEEFLQVFSRRDPLPPAWSRAAAIV